MTPPDDIHPDDAHGADGGEGEWISNEPPVDDFGDPSLETATVSEGNEHAHEESASEEPPVEEKKKFPFLLLAGAVGSLVVVGALAYWQFGGHDEQPSLLDLAAQNAAPVAVPHFASKPTASADTQPASSNLASKGAVSPVEPPPSPQITDVAPTTGYSVPSANSEAVKPIKMAVQEAGSAVPSAGAAASAPLLPPSADIVLDKDTHDQAPVAVAAAPANAVSDARLTVLSARIDDLQKSLSQATAQLGQINDKLSAGQAPSAVPAPVAVQPDAATQERLDKLEQKLIQMEQHQATLPASAPQLTAVDTVFPPQAVKKPKHTSPHKAPPRKVAHQAPKVAAEKWILRAATPDEAWIAKSVDSRELRPVHVGDDLPGIGKVTSIRQVGDAWVLQGTSGTIR